jgi:hypothetical protein
MNSQNNVAERWLTLSFVAVVLSGIGPYLLALNDKTRCYAID